MITPGTKSFVKGYVCSNAVVEQIKRDSSKNNFILQNKNLYKLFKNSSSLFLSVRGFTKRRKEAHPNPSKGESFLTIHGSFINKPM
jgi:hypothetical protein